MSIDRELFNVIFLELNDLIFALQVHLHLVDAHILYDIEENELVRNDAHLLERYCLKPRAREAFYDPAACRVFLLQLLNLQADELNHNLVSYVGVRASRFNDLLAKL